MASQVTSQIFRRSGFASGCQARCLSCTNSAVAGPSIARTTAAALQSRHLHSTRLQAQEVKQEVQAGAAGSLPGKPQKSGIDLWTQGSTAAPSKLASHQHAPSPHLASLGSSTTRPAQRGTKNRQPTSLDSTTSKLPSFSFARPKQRSVKYKHHVCTLRLSAYSDRLENLTFYSQFCVHAAFAFGLPCTLPAPLPVKTSLRTVPRSPFVHKPSQENFVKKEHTRTCRIYDADASVVGQWLDYITENAMSGVRLKASIFERKPLGYGKDMLDEPVLEPTDAQKVKEMAESLLASGFGETSESAEAEAVAGKTEEAVEPEGNKQ